MRWMILCFLMTMPLCAGCSRDKMDAPAARDKAAFEGAKPASPVGKGDPAAAPEFVAHQDADKAQAEKKENAKPRKIRYTADMKLIVEKLGDAEEALDAARKEANAEYEKMEVNTSVNTVRSGMWRVRVPVDNLNRFRKAVKKIGDVERDTIESEDMTAKYYDLDAHLTNRKAEQKATREFLVEIGKKDPRYLEVKRELDAISDDINVKEGRLKLWANLTDLTTFTITMREKQQYNPAPAPKVEPTPTFGERADKTWSESWDLFLGFCQGALLIAIAVAPWLPIPLTIALVLWVMVRVLVRLTRKPAVVETVELVAEPESKKP